MRLPVFFIPIPILPNTTIFAANYFAAPPLEKGTSGADYTAPSQALSLGSPKPRLQTNYQEGA